MAVVLFRWRQETLVKKVTVFSYRESEELSPEPKKEETPNLLENICKQWIFFTMVHSLSALYYSFRGVFRLETVGGRR